MKTDSLIPETILIVDDNEINRAVLKEIFKKEYDIEEAENGQSALEILTDDSKKICAVLLDVVMPVMDGITLVREMKAKGLLAQTPVFLITAEADGQMVRDAYELGVMDVISKPVISYIVQRRVNSVIELFRARKRLNNMVRRQQLEIEIQAKKIMELNLGMIASLSTAIEFRSCESGEHVRRIHDITYFMLMHTKLGKHLTKAQIDLIALASMMHDLGKIAISDAILNKPGKLTPEEYELMKTHTVQGAQLLEHIPQMRSHAAYRYAYDIALHHHERWDGGGYPEGLKGNEISIWAQVVSLADVYDALVSKRVYKDAFGYDTALQMILGGKCGVFNPSLLDIFIKSEEGIRKFYNESGGCQNKK